MLLRASQHNRRKERMKEKDVGWYVETNDKKGEVLM
jgi:hypothetical protein